MHRTTERRILRDFASRDQEFQILVPALLTQEDERVDEALEILVRLDIAGIHHESILKLVSLPDVCHLLFRRLSVKVIGDRVVNDGDLILRHGKEAEDVPLRGFGDGQDSTRSVDGGPERAAGVTTCDPVREVLREDQVDAVVNRDDGTTGCQDRQDVVWCVEQLRAGAPDVYRD